MTYYGARRYDQWHSDQTDLAHVATSELETAHIVIWDRAPERVVETLEMNLANWPEDYEKAWHKAGQPNPDLYYGRPMRIRVRRDDQDDAPVRLGIAPANYQWPVLPEHYTVCRRCGELPPCSEVFTEQVMRVERRRMDFEMTIVHGACHGCGKTVKGREHSVLFPGENLVRPDLGPNTAVFHTRQSCLSVALSYEARWLAADPARKPRVGQAAQ